MGGEEEAEGEEELLKTKNITISVPKTARHGTLNLTERKAGEET